jgi:hypothetical protein
MRVASTIATVTATTAAAVLFGTLGNADAGSSNGRPAPRHAQRSTVAPTPNHQNARARTRP